MAPARSPQTTAVPRSPDAPLWVWAHHSITRRAEAMFVHLAGVRAGADIEAVHDMRVGSRRVVAAMRVFRDCFPTVEFRNLAREARGITDALGAVRDLDVLIEHATLRRRDAADEVHPALAYLIAVWGGDRRRARRPMLRELARLEKTRYLARMEQYLTEEFEAHAVGMDLVHRRAREDSPLPSGGRTSFREAAPLLLGLRYANLYSFEPYVEHPEATTELHAMRIAAKWFRYTMELFSPAYADSLREPLEAVRRFQELLGDLHDSDVRLDLLQAARRGTLNVDALVEIGELLPDPIPVGLDRLHADEQQFRHACYLSFRDCWRLLAADGFAGRCRERIANPDALRTEE